MTIRKVGRTVLIGLFWVWGAFGLIGNLLSLNGQLSISAVSSQLLWIGGMLLFGLGALLLGRGPANKHRQAAGAGINLDCEFERKFFLRADDMMRIAIVLVFILAFIGPTFSQPATVSNTEDVQKGHFLAIRICAICHLAAPDQPAEPIMNPPAPSFASIVQHKKFNAESLTHFLTTTHRGLDNPKGMSNPDLLDYQIKQVVAYFLSLYPK